MRHSLLSLARCFIISWSAASSLWMWMRVWYLSNVVCVDVFSGCHWVLPPRAVRVPLRFSLCVSFSCPLARVLLLGVPHPLACL